MQMEWTRGFWKNGGLSHGIKRGGCQTTGLIGRRRLMHRDDPCHCVSTESEWNIDANEPTKPFEYLFSELPAGNKVANNYVVGIFDEKPL